MSEDKDTKISKQVIGVSPELLKLQDSLGKGRSVIGIDIGSTSVNVVQVASHYGKLTLIKASLEPISVVQERDRENLTIAALKKVLSRFHTKKADIVCVLSSRQTMVESILMPLMPKEELFHAVNLVVTNSKRFNVEKPIFDFQVAGRTNQDGAEKLNVTTAVIDRMSVDNLLAKFTLRQAKPLAGANSDLQTEGPVGLEVTAIIPLAIAVENIIRKSKLRTDEIVAIVEMGSLATELNIYRDSHLELSRQISVTSATLTHSLTRSFFTDKGRVELTVAEAEEIKKKYGIARWKRVTL
jgi:Tfp pilus assembly PilM family ATPase